MNANLFFIVAAFTFTGPSQVGPQINTPVPQTNNVAKVAQLEKLLEEIHIDTKDFQSELPLAKFLTTLEGKLPEGKRISLRLDEEAFGKDLATVAAYPVQLRGHPKTLSLEEMLSQAMSQMPKTADVDFAIRTSGIVITRAPQAAHLVTYDIHDVMKQLPQTLFHLKRLYPDLLQDETPSNHAELLVHYLCNSVKIASWETVRVLNGTKLAAYANPRRHQEIKYFLAALRRMADEAVVMNARLYAVDRTFYAKQVAPLFAGEEHDRPTVCPLKDCSSRRSRDRSRSWKATRWRSVPARTRRFYPGNPPFALMPALGKTKKKDARLAPDWPASPSRFGHK